ncbi:D-cysteine desulfhydrase family protein [Chloroflexi bacterium TSY]|nr:D-cysteine desulfhydrase family protein [Chloroflexi bacterium TSY]
MILEKALARYPRETLTRTPTPLDYLPHLSRQLGVNLYIKRDDLTDLALGGDKPRKLEYELAHARAQGADTIITCGSSQSNHARLTTAAARKVGMDCAVVLSHDERQSLQGNLLTVYLMGARVKLVEVDDHWALEEHALSLCERLKAEGRNPYYIPVSGTTPTSCLGYVRCGLEVLEQLQRLDVKLDAVYTPFGTGGIFTSMLMAFRQNGIQCPFVGISVNRKLAFCTENLNQWWSALADLLDVKTDARNVQNEYGNIEIYDEFIGKEYGDPTEACLDAIVRMAQAEGILLDPVYSGKMFSGFLAHCEAGRWSAGQSILLVHSGGVPALFAYQQEIEAHMRKQNLLR